MSQPVKAPLWLRAMLILAPIALFVVFFSIGTTMLGASPVVAAGFSFLIAVADYVLLKSMLGKVLGRAQSDANNVG